jgi:aryl-alcohol dehydrogenase-like predicted oxidoreductase
MLESVKASLTKLNLSRLDICYLHQNDLEIISDLYVHEGLLLLKQQGLIQHAGASLYSHQECEYALGSGIFDFIQVPINVFDISFYNAFIKDNKTSVRFVARSLLLQGILANRTGIREGIVQADQVLKYLEKLDELAKQYNISTLEMALAFVFSLDKIDHYIVGTTNIKHLKDITKCLSHKLPDELIRDLTNLAVVSKDWANPRNWKQTPSYGKT